MDVEILHPHPAAPPLPSLRLDVAWRRHGHRLRLEYRLSGSLDRLLIPPPAPPARTDGLWRHSCFELFAAGAGDSYAEFNLSPSGEWAAYAFDNYRSGMRDLDTPPPAIRAERSGDALTVGVALTLPADATALGLAAVIEDRDGALSYWALAHPPGRPDFHHPDCFALKLPPASAA